MDLLEAIKYYEEAAEHNEELARIYNEQGAVIASSSCKECAEEHRQLVEWLRELETYRRLIANADKLIESEYGVVIIEGYKDVLAQMKEIYEEVNADE